MGISTATPRVKVSGPLRRGRAWFSQAFSYRFVRSQVKEEIPGDDEEIVEGFDVFTQIDVKLSDRHSVTATLSVFPTDVENVPWIDSLHPAFASPDTEIGGWNVAIADELATGPTTRIWQTQFALRGFDVAVRPKGTDPHSSARTGCPAITISTRSIGRAASWSWGLPAFRAGVGAPRSMSSRSVASYSPRRSTASTAAAPLTCEARTGGSSSGSPFAGQASWTPRMSSPRWVCAGQLAGQSPPRAGSRSSIRLRRDARGEPLVAAYRVFAEARCGRAEAHQGRVAGSSSTRSASKSTPSTGFNSALNRTSTGPKPRRRVGPIDVL